MHRTGRSTSGEQAKHRKNGRSLAGDPFASAVLRFLTCLKSEHCGALWGKKSEKYATSEARRLHTGNVGALWCSVRNGKSLNSRPFPGKFCSAPVPLCTAIRSALLCCSPTYTPLCSDHLIPVSGLVPMPSGPIPMRSGPILVIPLWLALPCTTCKCFRI